MFYTRNPESVGVHDDNTRTTDLSGLVLDCIARGQQFGHNHIVLVIPFYPRLCQHHQVDVGVSDKVLKNGCLVAHRARIEKTHFDGGRGSC